jgi:hypothetical protein
MSAEERIELTQLGGQQPHHTAQGEQVLIESGRGGDADEFTVTARSY